jgi:hypothetical protein
MKNRNRSRALKLIALIAVFATAILILERLRLPHDSLLWQELYNTGHTPLFGVLSMVWLGLILICRRKSDAGMMLPYVLAFVATALTGLLSEASQIFRDRDADFWDFVRDLSGAFAFLAGVFAIVRFRLRQIRRAILAALASTVVLLASVTPLAITAYAYSIRDSYFPHILDFERASISTFITESECKLDRVEPPAGFDLPSDRRVGKLTLYPGMYPGIRIDDPYPDWTGYSTFALRCWSDQSEPFNLVVRIDDRHHNQEVNDRYNRSFLISPGLNTIEIPLEEVRNAPIRRSMDMAGIDVIFLFVFENQDTLELYLDDPVLE